MSGHSKWSTIKRKKAATDAKRAKIFTKMLREVQVAAREGGSSIDANTRLRTAVAAAKAASVPNDNIERAIKRGAGDTDGEQFEEVTYEAYGPGGVALLIKSLTDNRNRTVAEVRHALSRHGGSIGGSNAVAFLFQERGVIKVPKEYGDYDTILELALECGGDDVIDAGEVWVVLVARDDFDSARTVFEKLGKDVESDFYPVPLRTVPVVGEDAETLQKLLDYLDDLDDVQRVIGNFEMDEGEE